MNFSFRFKNVSLRFINVRLGNVLSASYKVTKPSPFVSAADNEILNGKWPG